jgi:hypothetical protein
MVIGRRTNIVTPTTKKKHRMPPMDMIHRRTVSFVYAVLVGHAAHFPTWLNNPLPQAWHSTPAVTFEHWLSMLLTPEQAPFGELEQE